ncbi:SGNH/GDSL hydrolase family protein [Pseudogracilibacillus sp. SE30717A]|uniref:SGNH/GDSL hydrolase family protein n=1 Tax=Pseudogracilibacillus sp. SE30717A TaxID=3098293 RepID=UPI00300E0825
MITIKKLIFIILILTGGLILFIFAKEEPTPTKPIKEIVQPKDEHNIDDKTASPEEQEEEDIEVAVKVKEDPIREFISDKLKKASSFFFTHDVNVVTLGDSLTEGSGDETNNSGYVGILDDTINQDKQVAQFQNFAKRGSRSGQLLIRLEDEDVTEALDNADIVLITIGANDIMQVFKENFTDLTLEKFTSEQIRYEQRLENIFTKIQEINGEADIYLIGFYNPFQEYFADIEELEYIVDSWNQIGEDVTEKYSNVHYIPIKDLFDNAETNYFSDDNFHPNALGYRLMANRILQYVLDEGDGDEHTEATIQ